MNWDLIGHDWAVRLFQDHLQHNRLRHAYLLTGPQGLGRRTLALRLAQAVNCPQPLAPAEPCRVCSTCKRIEAMQHPDLSVVQAENEGGTLKVEQVRELQRTLSLAPYEARYKIALLLRFEEAHASAANALLKTLEEPPAQVILILTADSVENLLPTIVSRCEVLRLRPLSLEQVFQNLQARWQIPAEEARLLAHLSGGRLGYALALHAAPERMEQRQAWIDDLLQLLKSPRAERFAYAQKLADNKDNTRQALQVWLSLWRDIMLRAAQTELPISNLDRRDEIAGVAERLDLGTVRQTVAALERTLLLIERNVNTRLATEVLFLDLPRV